MLRALRCEREMFERLVPGHEVGANTVDKGKPFSLP